MKRDYQGVLCGVVFGLYRVLREDLFDERGGDKEVHEVLGDVVDELEDVALELAQVGHRVDELRDDEAFRVAFAHEEAREEQDEVVVVGGGFGQDREHVRSLGDGEVPGRDDVVDAEVVAVEAEEGRGEFEVAALLRVGEVVQRVRVVLVELGVELQQVQALLSALGQHEQLGVHREYLLVVADVP